MRSGCRVVVAACAIGCGRPAPRSDDRPAAHFHRAQAGERGLDGWTVASSTGGHFRVQLPFAFDDYEKFFVDRGTAMPAIAHAVAGEGQVGGADGVLSQLRTQVVCMSRIDGTVPRASEPVSKEGLRSIRRGQFAGFDIDARRVKDAIKRTRMLSDGTTMCMLEVVALDNTALPDTVVERIFESFRVD
jgi:hypothetical protein